MIRKSKAVEEMIHQDKRVELTTLSVGYNSVREKNKAVIYVKLVPKEDQEAL